jgi:hypothetical protein
MQCLKKHCVQRSSPELAAWRVLRYRAWMPLSREPFFLRMAIWLRGCVAVGRGFEPQSDLDLSFAEISERWYSARRCCRRSRIRAPVWPGTFLRRNINMIRSRHDVASNPTRLFSICFNLVRVSHLLITEDRNAPFNFVKVPTFSMLHWLADFANFRQCPHPSTITAH